MLLTCGFSWAKAPSLGVMKAFGHHHGGIEDHGHCRRAMTAACHPVAQVVRLADCFRDDWSTRSTRGA